MAGDRRHTPASIWVQQHEEERGEEIGRGCSQGGRKEDAWLRECGETCVLTCHTSAYVGSPGTPAVQLFPLANHADVMPGADVTAAAARGAQGVGYRPRQSVHGPCGVGAVANALEDVVLGSGEGAAQVSSSKKSVLNQQPEPSKVPLIKTCGGSDLEAPYAEPRPRSTHLPPISTP